MKSPEEIQHLAAHLSVRIATEIEAFEEVSGMPVRAVNTTKVEEGSFNTEIVFEEGQPTEDCLELDPAYLRGAKFMGEN